MNPATLLMNQYTVPLSGGSPDETATIEISQNNSKCHVAVSCRGRGYAGEAADYFAAFVQVRQQLEAEGLVPVCYGASLDVYPSGMCRDRGAGIQAYKLAIGSSPERTDLRHIFDTGPDVKPASVADQLAYFERWLHPPKRRRGRR